ncbi:2-deoxyglucose-6-phosphatase [Citrobacter koseri]|uniref:2-deoxyglucose-6-phosphatase n=1 Tax=Citrobacter koseri TaxID=545 RepID=A0A2X2VKE2_CITKO|nr:2-deoxyglucose-6-phosphatase [Citrobacter koseri]
MRLPRVWCEYCPLQTDPGVLESAIRKRITGLIATEGEAMDGVYAVLHHFRHRGYRIALATSSSHQVIEAVLSKLNLRGILTSFAAPTMNATANRTRRCISPC